MEVSVRIFIIIIIIVIFCDIYFKPVLWRTCNICRGVYQCEIIRLRKNNTSPNGYPTEEKNTSRIFVARSRNHRGAGIVNNAFVRCALIWWRVTDVRVFCTLPTTGTTRRLWCDLYRTYPCGRALKYHGNPEPGIHLKTVTYRVDCTLRTNDSKYANDELFKGDTVKHSNTILRISVVFFPGKIITTKTDNFDVYDFLRVHRYICFCFFP